MHPIDQELKLMLEGKFAEGWKISEEMQAMGPEGIVDEKGKPHPELWPRHSFNRGWFLLQQGLYQEGCQLLENGRSLQVYGNGFLKTAAPLWNPELHPTEGKKVILSLEGGFGDEIIHARFATDLKKLGFDKVYIAAAPQLISVLSRIEGVDAVFQRDQAHTVAHDYWVPAFSAGWVCGNTFDTIYKGPYLSVLPDSRAVWNSFINTDKIKVGIRWAGNPKFEHQQFRLFPNEFLTNLSNYSELQLFSFQRDDNVVDLPENIIDLQHMLISWEDTLAALEQMDLVITSCTSVAHAAAALGKPTWVIVPVLPYHTWAWGAPESSVSPYYGSVKLFRQQEAKSWGKTFDLLYGDLEKQFNLASVEMPSVNETKIKLNIGDSSLELDGFVNIDTQDLMTFPWPFADNSVDHIVARDILERVGKTTDDFVAVLTEMTRVSSNIAAWEVQIPHHLSNGSFEDPAIMRRLTPKTFSSIPALDIEVCDTKYMWNPDWIAQIEKEELTEEQMMFNLKTFNNVAEKAIILLQVHKPHRNTLVSVTTEPH